MSTTQKHKVYMANEVAKYLIFLASQKVIGDNQEREGVSNLKLQKLLYFAQAYYLSILGRPLFGDKLEAWAYGPVVPGVYQKYKKYKNTPIISETDKSNLDGDDKEVLRKVWDIFGGYSAGRLVDIAHAHTPWKEAYTSNDKVITNKTLAEYYTPLLKK